MPLILAHSIGGQTNCTNIKHSQYLEWSFFFNLFLKLLFFKFYFILLYNNVLVLPYINMNPPRVYMCSQSWTPLPPPSPYHPSGSSQRTSPKHPVSCILHQTWTGDLFLIWYYTCFNAILPNHPTLSFSHRVQKSVLYVCVSFALLHIGLSLPLSKSHIYALVYCIGVILSGLLHSG